MKVVFRVSASVLALIICLAAIDFFVDGLVKYILWSVVSAFILAFNRAKNRELKKM
ncbi:hypothetical protein [Bacillus salacetis]|uniref:hypothetical protein n=1 Tax=Bacillus salacetis TaxID=2315464 RepID=UPI0014446B22|nr:hypothetical protein [Bacillus salacetis]